MLVVALVLAGSGAAAAWFEAKAYFSAGILPRERFDALAAGPADPGLSYPSHSLALQNCLEAMTSIFAATQPRKVRAAVAANCLVTADGITAQEPSNTLGWYVGALAANGTGDTAGMIERLRQAQITGPSEQWIVERRVDLAEDHLAALPPDVLAAHDRDLTLLAQSQRGVASIARRYVRQADFRDRITALVEKLPDWQQGRFLEYVRAAAGRGG